MLSNKNQNTEETKKLLLLVGATTGIVLLVLLVAMVGDMLRRDNQDLFSLVSRSMAETFPQSVLKTLGNQARLMGLPLATGSQAFWYLARAGGIVSYILLWLATCWGIMMSSKFLKGYGIVPTTFALHEFLPILGVVFAALHALALLGDTYIGFDVWQLLVPFTSSYKPFWTGVGSLAFYIFVALIISFYIRKQMGQKVWRALHYTSYLAFLIALLHGLMAGSDSSTLAMRVLYLTTGSISLFLLYYRLLSHAPRKSRDHSSHMSEMRANIGE